METATGTPSTPQQEPLAPARSESEGDVVFYTEEPKACESYFNLYIFNNIFLNKYLLFYTTATPNRQRRGDIRGMFMSQSSSVTEAPR